MVAGSDYSAAVKGRFCQGLGRLAGRVNKLQKPEDDSSKRQRTAEAVLGQRQRATGQGRLSCRLSTVNAVFLFLCSSLKITGHRCNCPLAYTPQLQLVWLGQLGRLGYFRDNKVHVVPRVSYRLLVAPSLAYDRQTDSQTDSPKPGPV